MADTDCTWGLGVSNDPGWPLLPRRQDRRKVTGNTSDSFRATEETRHQRPSSHCKVNVMRMMCERCINRREMLRVTETVLQPT